MADETSRFGSSIERILILNPGPGGSPGKPEVYYRKGAARKLSGSKILKPLEQFVRNDVEASKEALDSYLQLHTRSNRRKSDGWLRDLGNNFYRAAKSWRKKLKRALESDED